MNSVGCAVRTIELNIGAHGTPYISSCLLNSLDSFNHNRYWPTNRITHRRMPLSERKQIINLLITRIRLDVHPDANRLVTDWRIIIQCQQPLQIHLTNKLGGKPANIDTPTISNSVLMLSVILPPKVKPNHRRR